MRRIRFITGPEIHPGSENFKETKDKYFVWAYAEVDGAGWNIWLWKDGKWHTKTCTGSDRDGWGDEGYFDSHYRALSALNSSLFFVPEFSGS